MHSIRNTFTANLSKAIKNSKINYMNKKMREGNLVRLADPVQIELIADVENRMRERTREAVCQNGISNAIAVDWQQSVQDERLHQLFLRLTRREQDIVCRRMFLKQSFADIGSVHNLTGNQAKHVYYYAISKMRRYSDGI